MNTLGSFNLGGEGHLFFFFLGFPDGSESKESVCSAGDKGSIPGLGRSPGEGNGYPLQYSCLENSKDRSLWDHKSSDRLSD